MMTFFNVLWFFLVFFLITMYFILDGFDLGSGVLYSFIGKDDKEKSVIRRAIGPVWDGNEVWLLTAGGALFAAFPPAYATTFSGFYLAIMLVLFGLIVRAVAVEFAGRDRAWAKLWDTLFFVGSLLPALLLGVAVGNIFAGIPMSANGDYIGVPLLGLITPFTLTCGLLGLSLFLMQGAMWLALKAPENGALQKRAAGLRMPLVVVVLLLFCVATFFAMGSMGSMDPMFGIVRILCAVLFVVCLLAGVMVGRKGADLQGFILSSLAIVFLMALLATSMFPNLVVASAGSIGPTITLMNAASTDTSLMYTTIITCIGVPLVILYHVLVYRAFRGRIKEEDLGEY